MSDQIEIGVGEIEALARKLDGVESFDARERDVLNGVLAFAVNEMSQDAEVSGFGASKCTCSFNVGVSVLTFNAKCPLHSYLAPRSW